ncbi:hypothetical protein N7478_008307 [Penicillium angulare]|uniref:uncharacterized protein n=1 Tax=Penicillium angulare TaxID=116970 RepID=UPI0025411315|nr:uncharacterized protein N7478_008307 [Penicillium angulare]KAJ5273182.1 hypothetical protein N7478_008307 [Penicillium angulare]
MRMQRSIFENDGFLDSKSALKDDNVEPVTQRTLGNASLVNELLALQKISISPANTIIRPEGREAILTKLEFKVSRDLLGHKDP